MIRTVEAVGWDGATNSLWLLVAGVWIKVPGVPLADSDESDSESEEP